MHGKRSGHRPHMIVLVLVPLEELGARRIASAIGRISESTLVERRTITDLSSSENGS